MTPRWTWSPRDPAFYADPYPHYRAMRGLGDLFDWTDYGFACSARHAVVSAALRERRFGREPVGAAAVPSSDPALEPFRRFEANSLLEREPPVHTRLRGLVNRAFTGRTVERLGPGIARLAHDLIDAIEPAGGADLIEAFATPIPVVVICRLLGVPEADADRLLAWSHRMVAIYRFGADAATALDCAAATAEFSAYVAALVEERRRRPGDDLLGDLIAARDAGDRLDDDELVATAILLLNAGHEATVHAIGNAVRLLIAERLGAGAFAGPEATEALVEETLRYDPPLHLFTRTAREDFEFAGRRFRTGETIGLLLAAANRDPAAFEEPDRFVAARRPGRILSFGAGIHFCVGAPLARLELATALPILFQRLPRLALAAEPRWRDGYHFRGLERLDVAW